MWDGYLTLTLRFGVVDLVRDGHDRPGAAAEGNRTDTGGRREMRQICNGHESVLCRKVETPFPRLSYPYQYSFITGICPRSPSLNNAKQRKASLPPSSSISWPADRDTPGPYP